MDPRESHWMCLEMNSDKNVCVWSMKKSLVSKSNYMESRDDFVLDWWFRCDSFANGKTDQTNQRQQGLHSWKGMLTTAQNLVRIYIPNLYLLMKSMYRVLQWATSPSQLRPHLQPRSSANMVCHVWAATDVISARLVQPAMLANQKTFRRNKRNAFWSSIVT